MRYLCTWTVIISESMIIPQVARGKIWFGREVINVIYVHTGIKASSVITIWIYTYKKKQVSLIIQDELIQVQYILYPREKFYISITITFLLQFLVARNSRFGGYKSSSKIPYPYQLSTFALSTNCERHRIIIGSSFGGERRAKRGKMERKTRLRNGKNSKPYVFFFFHLPFDTRDNLA